MENILRRFEAEDMVFYGENTYRDVDRDKYTKIFREMQEDGIILSGYEEDYWLGYSDVRKYGIDFLFDEIAYRTHFYASEDISADKMRDILKCYAIYQAGTYVLPTIKTHIELVKRFITRAGDADYAVTQLEAGYIMDFLGFLGIPERRSTELLAPVHLVKTEASRQRELAPLITYIAVAEEINDMYSMGALDAEFIRWFPLYFWVNVTFVVPLRATEMTVTPFGCIVEKDGEQYIRIRRTKLKGRRNTVFYKVEKDYGVFEYRVPDTDVVRNILKYERLTAGTPRRFLFLPGKYSVNGVFTLQRCNGLLAEFIRTRLIGNHRYDYARFACGIKEFPVISVGDSRPIAMANLYYQGVGADICRQLADHVRVSTSAGYYTNVSNTVYASSVMQLQRRLNAGYEQTELYRQAYTKGNNMAASGLDAGCGCMSPKKPHATGDISDCVMEDHIHECLGCRYFRPTAEQVEKALLDRREKLDRASREVLCYMEDKDKIKTREKDFDRAINDAHTGIVRYRTACDEKAGKELEKWTRKATQKN